MKLLHLARRLIQSLNNAPLENDELQAAASVLSANEFAMWSRLANRDQRHSLLVLRRFDAILPGATVSERRAALLHDIGKIDTIGVAGRVFATLVGPRTKRFDQYLKHEKIGVELMRGVSDSRTLFLLSMPPGDPVADALRRADDV